MAETRDDLLADAFGPAQEPMTGFVRRVATGFLMNDDQIALLLADIEEARARAASADVGVREGILDMAAYVHYIILVHRYRATPAGTPERHAAAEALLRYAWGIYFTALVETYVATIRVILPAEAADAALQASWNLPSGTAYAGVTQLGPTDFLANFTQDLAAYTDRYTPPAFASTLTPLMPAGSGTPRATPSFATPHNFALYVRALSPGGTQSLLRIYVGAPHSTNQRIDSGRMLITIKDSQGRSVHSQLLTCGGWNTP